MNAPTITVLSLGAGVQSTTLALLAVEGVLPKPDAAIFADTGWEPKAVYEHLDRLRPVMAAAGIPVHLVSRGNLRDRPEQMPVFTRDADNIQGITGRQCTADFKLAPIKKKVREMLGYPHPARVPDGVWALQWIGFSTDEVHRVSDKSDVRYSRPAYPLLDLGMSRKDCERWLRARGWTTTKSACIGCPFHGNAAWRQLRDTRPDEWADAVALDRSLRVTGVRGVTGDAYLHRSCLPLDEAPIGRVTRREWNDRQGDMLDVLAEEGDPDGCSPYGCRSGKAVA